MVFDTGSGHVIVPSVLCDSETCKLHSRYNVALSGVAKEIDSDGTILTPGAARDQVTIGFGTGEVQGQFASERICLGVIGTATQGSRGSARASSTGNSPECVDMRIIMATDMSEEPFAAFTFDGVLGLGLESLAMAPEYSFFSMFARSAVLESPRFGVYLADADDDFSEISFGGHNPDRVKSDISWSSIPDPDLGHWQARVMRLRVGNDVWDFCDDGTCRLVVDTGTSLITTPSSIFDQLQDTLTASVQDPPEHEGRVDCRKTIGHVLYFDLDGGGTLELLPQDYTRPSIFIDGDDEGAVLKATELLSDDVPHRGEEARSHRATGVGPPASDISSSWNTSVGGDPDSVQRQSKMRCLPTLMAVDLPAPLGPKMFILGEPVLRKYYTVYDWHQKRVGFALAKHRTNEEETMEIGRMNEEQVGGPLLDDDLLSTMIFN